MNSLRRIVVGYDFSDSAARALQVALELAGRSGGSVTVLHVVPAEVVEDFEAYYDRGLDAVLDGMRTKLDEAVAEQPGTAACKVESRVEVGYPHAVLLDAAAPGVCDLLMLGKRGQNHPERPLGFFASRCVRHALVPVWLVDPERWAVADGVAACVDLSDATHDVITAAASIAGGADASLSVVHAVCPPWMQGTHVLYNLTPFEDSDYQHQYTEILEASLAAAVHAAGSDAEPRILMAASPIDTLLRDIREGGAGLAVVGRRGSSHRSFRELLLGSTAEKILHHARLSVLCVPDSSDS